MTLDVSEVLLEAVSHPSSQHHSTENSVESVDSDICLVFVIEGIVWYQSLTGLFHFQIILSLEHLLVYFVNIIELIEFMLLLTA